MAKQERHTFALEAEAEERIWQQMNVYLHLYLYDEQGVQIGMWSGALLVLDAAHADEQGVQIGMCSVQHQQGPAPERLRVESPEAVAQVKVCLYVVPRRLPDSPQVADSPPMNLTLRILRDGKTVDTLHRRINSWGGDQLIGLAYQ